MRPPRPELGGKVVLITGPARGIGEAVARDAAARGATLALIGLEPDRLERLAAELGARHSWAECDVTDQAALARAVATAIKPHGGIDVVVANAGIATNGMVSVTSADALARVIEVNLIGVIRTVRTTLDAVTARRGYYLLISSAAALVAAPGIATYGAAKSGVEMFGNALRLELRHKGVAVGVAHPSWIDTDMVRDLQDDLVTFRETVASLPGPFGTITPVAKCAEQLVNGIVRRQRKIFIPRSLGIFSILRQLLTNPIADLLIARRTARLVTAAEAEVRALGRSFGKSSVEMKGTATGDG